MSALVTRGLTKRYGSIAAVDHLDLTVDQGVLYGFLGPNGSGKTTTIRMALGLIFPTEGSVEVLGHPVAGPSVGPEEGAERILDRVGAIVEEPAFWKYLTGRKNLEYFTRSGGSDPSGGSGDGQPSRLGQIDQTLRLVDLHDAAGKKVKAYSQGMRQRLGIALALLGKPSLLILDEPTNGLDPQGMREVRLLLRRLADEGTTVFVSSHLLSEVEAMCDRVGVLARGRLVAEGPPSALRASGERLRVQVSDRDRAERIVAVLPGVSIDPDGAGPGQVLLRLAAPATAAGVNARLVSEGVEVSALVPEQDSLEDVFVSLVERADAKLEGEGGADVPR
jgi:ABC-2 type transport system ATP-binding protein